MDSLATSLRRIQAIAQRFCNVPNVWQLRLSTLSSQLLLQNALCVKTSVSGEHEASSTYTYAAVGLEENESSSEAMWTMFQERHEHCFTTEDLWKVKTNLEHGKDSDPALLRKQIHIDDFLGDM